MGKLINHKEYSYTERGIAVHQRAIKALEPIVEDNIDCDMIELDDILRGAVLHHMAFTKIKLSLRDEGEPPESVLEKARWHERKWVRTAACLVGLAAAILFCIKAMVMYFEPIL